MQDLYDQLKDIVLVEAQATSPFNIKISKEKLSQEELISAVRQSIIAEQDAIILYETYINSTDNEKFKQVFEHVVEEEKHHLGEFQELLERLSGPEEKEEMDKGREETAEEFGEVDDDLGDNEEDTD